MRGNLGGSATTPTGSLHVRLTDGAIGSTRLSRAAAQVAVTPAQVLAVNLELAPAEAAGNVRLAGTVALPTSSGSTSASASGAAAGAAADEAVDLVVSVSDGGMALLSSLVPSFRWESGGANVSLRVSGSLAAPQLSGGASLSRAVVHSGYLRAPVTHLGGSISLDGNTLVAAAVEGRVGSKGHVRLNGALPVQPPPAAQLAAGVGGGAKRGEGSGSAAPGAVPAAQQGLELVLCDVEVRVRNLYAGSLDSHVTVHGSAAAPVIGGSMRLSRGTAYLIPQGSSAAAAPQAAAEAAAAAAGLGASSSNEAELVTTAFAALKAGRLRAAAQSALQVGGGWAAACCQAVVQAAWLQRRACLEQPVCFLACACSHLRSTPCFARCPTS